jgi:integrase/recombinase XerD
MSNLGPNPRTCEPSHRGSVFAGGPDPLAGFRVYLKEHIGERRRGLYERGARELLHWLSEIGTSASGVTAADVIAFKAAVSSNHEVSPIGHRTWETVEGARVYLRWLSCRGELVEDEDLFHQLTETLTEGALRSAFGDGLRARVLREVDAFGQALERSSLNDVLRAQYQRALVKLLFFLERRGTRVSDMTLADWVAFEVDTRERDPEHARLVLGAARAYLKTKGRADALPERGSSLNESEAAVLDGFLLYLKKLILGRNATLTGLRNRAAYERGAREVVAYLERTGKALGDITAADVAAVKQAIDEKEQGAAGGRRAWESFEGVRIFLRFKSCRGELREDEALFFALNERLTRAVVEQAFGDGLRARVLREAQAFERALAAQGVQSDLKRTNGQRAAVRLLFFLDRLGKTVEQMDLADWIRFEEEAAPIAGKQASIVLGGARAYLRWKGRVDALPTPAPRPVPPPRPPRARRQPPPPLPPRPRATDGVSEDIRRELLAFRGRVHASLGKRVAYVYTWGLRELLLFLERIGKTSAELDTADYRAFDQEMRARVDAGELTASKLEQLMCGPRRYLREKAEAGEIRDVSLIELVAPQHNRRLGRLLSVVSPQEAAIAAELDGFVEKRHKLGYTVSTPMQRGARWLMRFLAARRRELAKITAEDWQDFRREVEVKAEKQSTSVLLVGARSYLRMKAREGAIDDSQVPKAIVHRAADPALPPSLAMCLTLIDEATMASDLARTTRSTYRRALRDFLVWLDEQGVAQLSDVARELVTAYRLHIQTQASSKGTPYALWTQVSIFIALRFFFSWMVKTGRLLADPTRHLPYARRPQSLPKSLKVRDVARLLRNQPDTVLGIRDRAVLELLYVTGMRRAEVAKLKLQDVDLDQRQILVREGKGRKDRVVVMGEKAKKALVDYLEKSRPKLLRGTDDGSVFIGRRGEPLGEGQVTQRVIDLGRRIGLKIAPHLLRHTCATHLLRGRADIRQIQKLLGHASLNTTERYTKVEVTDLRKVIDRCHPREKATRQTP